LLLPLEKLNGICKGALQINWHGISSCASAIEFLRRKFSLVTEDCDDNGIITSPQDTSSMEMEYVGTNKIHFANCVVNADNIKDTWPFTLGKYIVLFTSTLAYLLKVLFVEMIKSPRNTLTFQIISAKGA